MIRKLSIGLIAVASLFLVVLAPDASAQCTDYNGSIVNAENCLDYPTGGFGSNATATPRPSSTPVPTSSAVVSADTVDATATAGGGASIAFTGSESRVLGYAGASLIGFGAIALAVARRKRDTDLD